MDNSVHTELDLSVDKKKIKCEDVVTCDAYKTYDAQEGNEERGKEEDEADEEDEKVRLKTTSDDVYVVQTARGGVGIMADWDPAMYLANETERNKPIFDLITHIPVQNPRRIIDIGCGPGNSTASLRKTYKEAEIIGIDNSPGMIAEARKADDSITWILRDANETMDDLGKFDILFSNSTLHWLPRHEALLPRLFNMVAEGGAAALQMPYYFGTKIYGSLLALIHSKKWNELIHLKQPATYHDVGFYYDILSECTPAFDIWTTRHIHVLKTKEDILDWYKPTGFKAYLDQLGTDEQKDEFIADMRPIVDRLYRAQKDGKYLLRFQRLFIVAHNRVTNKV